jgi:enamine deaminase RidA (YjgF/YER057c/UK114 family)
MSARDRLAELGLTLPPAPAPAAAYVPYVIDDGRVFTAGQLPVVDGTLPATGRLGAGIDVDQGQDLARTAALNLLAVAGDAVDGDLDGLRLVKLTVFVASDPTFTDQHLVANGASLLLHTVLGDQGIHARSAVGVASLPLDAPVEVEGIFAIRA